LKKYVKIVARSFLTLKGIVSSLKRRPVLIIMKKLSRLDDPKYPRTLSHQIEVHRRSLQEAVVIAGRVATPSEVGATGEGDQKDLGEE
jgi:hypothetical protein